MVSLGLFDIQEDPWRRCAANIRMHAFDAGAIAVGLGNFRLVNTVVWGHLRVSPFSPEILKNVILNDFASISQTC